MRLQRGQRGALMIEILITIFILVIGLGAILELQSRLQTSEMEAYQRTQAMILLNDMAQRINTNRAFSSSYSVDMGPPNGTAAKSACDYGTSSLAEQDQSEWCLALLGAAETQGSTRLGAMIGGRGCVDELVVGTEYRVTVTWQGLTPLAAPPSNITCGVNAYDDSVGGADCTGDLCRRYVSTVIRIAELDL